MILGVLFKIVKKWKEFPHPSTEEWINTLAYAHNVILVSNKLLIMQIYKNAKKVC